MTNTTQTTVNARHYIIDRRESVWCREPQREALLQELHDLATDPARHRLQSIAIVGESNAGKSSLVERYKRLHPVVRGESALVVPAISVNMSGMPRTSDLSVALLEALQAPDPKTGTDVDRMKRFVQLAREMSLGIVFMDEFHDCADTSGRGKPFLRVIKLLMNEKILVVPVGTEMLAEVLMRDPQLHSRFNFSRGRLQRIDDLGVLKGIMLHLSELDEDGISDAAVEFVLHESRGIMGHALDLIEGALLLNGDLKLASLRQSRLRLDVLDKVV